MRLLLLLTLTIFSLKATANMCSVFGEAWPVEGKYAEAKRTYKSLDIDTSYQLLFENIRKKSISVEEVIGFLDAHNTGAGLLIDKLRDHTTTGPTYNHPILRYLTAPVKVKSEKIRIQRSELKSEKELKVFIEKLLKSVYTVELKLLRSKLLHFYPQSKSQVEQIIALDRSYYENMDVFGKFIDLAPNDAIAKNPWFAALTSFFMNVSDPVLSHRLNQYDLNLFTKGSLDSPLRKKLLSSIVANNSRRQIFWASVLSAALLLPTNIAESNQAIAIAQKQAAYMTQNSELVVQMSTSNYQVVLNRILNEKISSYEESLHEAQKVNDISKIEILDAEIVELKSQLL